MVAAADGESISRGSQRVLRARAQKSSSCQGESMASMATPHHTTAARSCGEQHQGGLQNRGRRLSKPASCLIGTPGRPALAWCCRGGFKLPHWISCEPRAMQCHGRKRLTHPACSRALALSLSLFWCFVCSFPGRATATGLDHDRKAAKSQSPDRSSHRRCEGLSC